MRAHGISAHSVLLLRSDVASFCKRCKTQKKLYRIKRLFAAPEGSGNWIFISKKKKNRTSLSAAGCPTILAYTSEQEPKNVTGHTISSDIFNEFHIPSNRFHIQNNSVCFFACVTRHFVLSSAKHLKLLL